MARNWCVYLVVAIVLLATARASLGLPCADGDGMNRLPTSAIRQPRPDGGVDPWSLRSPPEASVLGVLSADRLLKNAFVTYLRNQYAGAWRDRHRQVTSIKGD